MYKNFRPSPLFQGGHSQIPGLTHQDYLGGNSFSLGGRDSNRLNRCRVQVGEVLYCPKGRDRPGGRVRVEARRQRVEADALDPRLGPHRW